MQTTHQAIVVLAFSGERSSSLWRSLATLLPPSDLHTIGAVPQTDKRVMRNLSGY